ncbi:MAG: ATP-binding protein [Candidatus Omnitrophota bacterium]
MTVKKVDKLIQTAKNLQSLLKELIFCIDDINEVQAQALVAAIDEKFKISDNNCDINSSSLRSMHSERLAAMGQMAAAISHELRNPLSGIKVAAEYLMRKFATQQDAMDIINNIHNEVIFANNIIANLLQHARIGKPVRERVNIKNLVEEAILAIAQQGSFNNIKIKRKIQDNLPQLLLDPMQIRQVFMNLFINSAEAMIGGGTLNIRIAKKTDKVVIQIIDTGCGIDQNCLDKLFEPFFSTKIKGIGLGLAITREIVENHNGQINVDSKKDKGTMFTISFPVNIKK